MSLADIRPHLSSRAALAARGMTDRELAAAVRLGRLIRLDRGFYVDRIHWDGAYSEGRHLMRVLAAHDRRRGGTAVCSHTSAAVVHELPLFRLEPRRVHLSGRGVDGRVRRSDPVVARHDIPVAEADIVVIDGIRCTSLARTVADVTRTAVIESALALADAAFRRVAWNDLAHTYDEDAAAAFRAAVARQLPAGGRGVRHARRTLELADGRAQLPGESISRLYLLELGFAPPRLQVAVPAPGGSCYYVDFGLDDVLSWGEFDGQGKYRDAAIRGDVAIEDAVLNEKMREDWIRGTTNRRFARWGMAHVASPRTLAERLARFHITAP